MYPRIIQKKRDLYFNAYLKSFHDYQLANQILKRISRQTRCDVFTLVIILPFSIDSLTKIRSREIKRNIKYQNYLKFTNSFIYFSIICNSFDNLISQSQKTPSFPFTTNTDTNIPAIKLIKTHREKI